VNVLTNDFWQNSSTSYGAALPAEAALTLTPDPVLTKPELGHDYTHCYIELRQAPFGGFADGTYILTQNGERPVESLRPGDMVQTVDHGMQPLRWTASGALHAQGADTQISFAPMAVGNTHRLQVSGRHRIIISGWRVELLIGAQEALIQARDLVNTQTITAIDPTDVQYTNLMFDRHEIIIAEGCRCESFLPTERNLTLLDPETRSALLDLFPELDWCVDTYGDAARLCLTGREARLLLS